LNQINTSLRSEVKTHRTKTEN